MRHSPFLGMDPFLEEPAKWGGVHSRLINTISDLLVPLAPAPYIVNIETNVYVTEPDAPHFGSPIRPDIYVVDHPAPTAVADARTRSEITPSSTVEPLEALETRERWLEIYDGDSNEVVSVIEILSPYNKVGDGFERFASKRKKVRHSKANWLEIDLLRAGKRIPELQNKSDYYAMLIRAEQTRPYNTWFFDLRDSLPVLPVPLRHGEDDLPLDLTAVLKNLFERAQLARILDYKGEVPNPQPNPPTERWIRRQIEAWRAAAV